MDQQPTPNTGNDLWSDDYPLEQMLGVLLGRLLSTSSIDDDQTARLCLTTTELAGLLPAEQRVDRAQATAEHLTEFLDEHGSVKPLAGSLRDWKVAIELVRSRFGWLELPPALRKRAHHRARVLLLAGGERGLLVQRDMQWLLTAEGERVARSWRAM